MSKVTAFCHITSVGVTLNGAPFLSADVEPGSDLLRKIYTTLCLDYPKFFKMDGLSKAALLGTELIVKNTELSSRYGDDDIALCFANSSSSADSDTQFKQSYRGGAASPALFVYTLPNILIGEIAIRNKWYGENLFVIMPKFNPDFFIDQAKIFMTKKAKACLCGWVNVYQNKTDAFFFLVEKESADKSSFELSSDKLITAYKS